MTVIVEIGNTSLLALEGNTILLKTLILNVDEVVTSRR